MIMTSIFNTSILMEAGVAIKNILAIGPVMVVTQQIVIAATI